MLTTQAEGTQAATVSTEHTLNAGAFTASGMYLLTVDTRNMVNIDEVELRAYVKTLAGDAQEYLLYSATYAQQQGDSAAPGSSAYGETVKVSIPIASPYSVAFTLKQTAGTSRDFPWRVDTL